MSQLDCAYRCTRACACIRAVGCANVPDCQTIQKKKVTHKREGERERERATLALAVVADAACRAHVTRFLYAPTSPPHSLGSFLSMHVTLSHSRAHARTNVRTRAHITKLARASTLQIMSKYPKACRHFPWFLSKIADLQARSGGGRRHSVESVFLWSTAQGVTEATCSKFVDRWLLAHDRAIITMSLRFCLLLIISLNYALNAHMEIYFRPKTRNVIYIYIIRTSGETTLMIKWRLCFFFLSNNVQPLLCNNVNREWIHHPSMQIPLCVVIGPFGPCVYLCQSGNICLCPFFMPV